MTELKTNASLLRALQEASKRGPTKKEVHEQRVSFIRSCIKDVSISREKIEKVLEKQEGRISA